MQKQILDFLKDTALTLDELSQQLGMTTAKAFKTLVKNIAQLEAQGAISITKNGKLSCVIKEQESLIGIYRANERGYGFVSVEGREDDIYIPKGNQMALSGDTVAVVITKQADSFAGKGAEGLIERIVQRAMTTLVGEFIRYPQTMSESTGYIGYIVPKVRTLSEFTCFVTNQGIQSVTGTICLVEITDYPSEHAPKSLIGHITKEIGHKDVPGVDILTVLHKFGIQTEFPESALQQAEAISQTISLADLDGRLDLRHEQIVTIDGADAKDLDDAISLSILDNGHYQLGVHIADVSHYVTESSPLDNEAFERATSVYLADRVVPMLPQRLSNGICSLHPNEDRLTLSCIMEINTSGQVVSSKIVSSVICSKKRMVYDWVNAAIVEGNKRAREDYADFLPMLELMREVHYALYHKRHRRGAIDFDTQEAKVLLDEHGAPVDILLRERGLAERMIESFMLCANETIAETFMNKEYPFMYRVHEQPAEDKMQRFMEFVTNFGVMMKGSSANVQSKALQKVLEKVEHQPYEAVVSTMLLRSMKQARYDVDSLGHFGLATDYYTHFTSPIRRYPDLIVHRLIKRYLASKPLQSTFDTLKVKLDDIARQSSQMERKAVEAERDVEAMKKAEYMLDKIGETFEGVISSVTRFGVFVELPNTIEGLIHVSKMDDDHYEFIENHLLLIGKRTGRTYQIGQRVMVEVTKVDVEARDIDFVFVLSKAEKKAKQKATAQQVIKKKREKRRHKRKRR